MTLVLIGLLPAAAVLAATRWIPAFGALLQTVGSADRLSTFASTGASFAFTLLGLVTGVLALFVSLKDTQSFQVYRQEGFLLPMQVFLVLTMVVLGASFFFSMALFFGEPGLWWLSAAVASVLSATLMSVLALLPFVAMQIRAANDD